MRRDRATLLAYAAQGLFGFMLYGSGVITGLVRAELGLGYLVVGGLAAVLTTGTILGAVLTGWLLRRGGGGGREERLLGAASGVVALGLAVVAVPGLPAVAIGFAIAGMAGGTIPPGGAWLLARRHGEQAARALLEVNVVGALAGVLAAVLLPAAQTAVTWRLALVVPVLAGVVLVVQGWRTARRAPAAVAPPVGEERRRRVLPSPSRWYIAVAVCGGLVEFGVVFWAADLIAQRTGATAAAATGTLAAFTGGLVVGRAALSLVTRSVDASRRVLVGSLVVAAAGGVGLLLVGTTWTAVAALLAVGLGTAALYPLALALAVASAGRAGARASALLSVCVGLGALAAPVVLAAGAEAVGMRIAFAGVPAAATVGIAGALLAGRSARRVAGAGAEAR